MEYSNQGVQNFDVLVPTHGKNKAQTTFSANILAEKNQEFKCLNLPFLAKALCRETSSSFAFKVKFQIRVNSFLIN